MTPQFVLDNLTALRSQWQESEQGEGKSLIDVQGSVGLLLYDVMEALRLSPQQQMMESHQYQTIMQLLMELAENHQTTVQVIVAATNVTGVNEYQKSIEWIRRG